MVIIILILLITNNFVVTLIILLPFMDVVEEEMPSQRMIGGVWNAPFRGWYVMLWHFSNKAAIVAGRS
jgi:hypothetical protein